MRADAKVLAATLSAGQTAEYRTDPARHCYLVSASGRIRVNGQEAGPRDGVAVQGETAILVEALGDAEVVLVDAI